MCQGKGTFHLNMLLLSACFALSKEEKNWRRNYKEKHFLLFSLFKREHEQDLEIQEPVFLQSPVSYTDVPVWQRRWSHNGWLYNLSLSLCHVRTQQEENHLQAMKRVFTRNQICQHLDLDLPSIQNCEAEASVA